MLYITFNDPPSGIYYSQVTDVCSFMSERFNINIKLVAFISLRNFFQNKNAIKKKYKNSIVLPMFPGVKNWKKNYFSLSFLKTDKIIARGPFAAWLALKLKSNGKANSVCFDARGAYAAEFNEYNVSGEANINSEIYELEKFVLTNSDKRISISNKLVEYWEKEYSYSGKEQVIIPCTLNKFYEKDYSYQEYKDVRKKNNITENEILLVYSGSDSPWQSLKTVYPFLDNILKQNENVKLLLLTKKIDDEHLFFKYGTRVIQKWLEPNNVRDWLLACDYAVLLREQSVTNQVASPVKFAEYLSCGLKILISENIGDYSEFVKRHLVGLVLNELNGKINFLFVPKEEKTRISKLGQITFSKSEYINSYKKLL